MENISTLEKYSYFVVSKLILNKIIGTGIYVSPRVVLAATESKGISLVLWLMGCVVTWAGFVAPSTKLSRTNRHSLLIYLEYGIRWPVTGGELYYVRTFRLQ